MGSDNKSHRRQDQVSLRTRVGTVAGQRSEIVDDDQVRVEEIIVEAVDYSILTSCSKFP